VAAETLAIIDSGLPGSAGTVLRYIESIGRRPEELSHILMTHAHPDHTGAASVLVRRTGAKIVAHRADARRRVGGPLTLNYMRLFGALPLPVPFLERTPVTHPVEDGELLPIAGGIRVLHTPGHTAGSLCFLEQSSKTLFSGDTIFSDGTSLSRSVPFPGYDGPSYRSSLARLATIDFEAVCGGHGTPLLKGGTAVLNELLSARPDPPTWARYLRSVPHRLRNSISLSGEEH
jgi:glyoxylase-like metal-dependent hydrolase (beta-lactamase superfamily II)